MEVSHPHGKAGRFSAGKPTWVVVHSSGNPNASLESEIADHDNTKQELKELKKLLKEKGVI